MNSKRILRTGIVIALAAVSAVSCVTNRKIAYLQDMKHNTQIELEDKFEAVISPYDELDVIISCFDSDLAKPFNIYSAAQSAVRTGQQNLAYLVDQYGDIEPASGDHRCYRPLRGSSGDCNHPLHTEGTLYKEG